MIKKVGTYLICLCLLFIFFIGSVNADIYSWVDEKGVTHYSTTPPKSDTELNFKIYQTGKPSKTKTPSALKNPIENIKSTLKSVVSPTAQKEQPQKTKVELYVTSWCPWCKKAKAFFQSKDVELIVYDVEKDPKAAQRKKQLDSKKGVPFVVVNGKHYVHGYSEEYYNEVLALKD